MTHRHFTTKHRRTAVATGGLATAACAAFAVTALASPPMARATTTASTTTSTRAAAAWTSSSGSSAWRGAWAAGGGWVAGAPARWRPRGTWRPSTPAHGEYFHVVSTRPGGPGTIIVAGVVNAGGHERPGRAIDQATFAGGSFRIDHSSGRPVTHFDPTTCVGTITQTGPFEVVDATGDMRALTGNGHYSFSALYVTDRVGGHCSSTISAYTEVIDGVVTTKA